MLDPKPQKQLSYLIFHLRSKASTCEGTSTEENISVFAHIICAKSALFKQSEQIFNNIKNDLDIRNKSASFFYYAYFLSISHQHRYSHTNIRNNIGSRLIERFCFVNGYLYLVEEKSFLSIFERTLSHFRNSSSLTNMR